MNEVGLRKAGEAAGLKINIGKTKTMVTGKGKYDNGCSKEIGKRIGRAT